MSRFNQDFSVSRAEETYDLLSAERKVDVTLYEAMDSSLPDDLPAVSTRD